MRYIFVALSQLSNAVERLVNAKMSNADPSGPGFDMTEQLEELQW